MERIQVEDGMIRWKKIGGGSFHMGNRIIKPNQVFTARVEDIPASFRDVVIPLDSIPVVPEVPIVITKTEYLLKPRGKSKTLFDVVTKIGVDDDGNDIFKAINEKVLTKEIAQNLITDLSR